MYSQMLKTINASDSRYLTEEEQEAILSYAASLPRRIQAARAVEQRESEIVEQVIAELKKRYTNFQNLHDKAWEKGTRDVQLVLRYNVQGMLMDAPELAPEKVLYWMRTIVASQGLTPKFCRDAYTFLRESIRAHVPAEVYGVMEPHINRTIEVMSEFPEPLAPAV